METIDMQCKSISQFYAESCLPDRAYIGEVAIATDKNFVRINEELNGGVIRHANN